MEFINIVYALPLAVFTDGFQFLDLCLRGLRHYDRLRRLIVECSYGRESIEAV